MIEPIELKTTWGPIRLTLKNGSVAQCDLPILKKTPNRPFKIDGFQSLETLIRNFPTPGIPDGTDFQRAVWTALRNIPRGETKTYGEIAAAIGRPNAMRAVGTACGANPLPLFIPCHRVVARNGLGGFGSGLPWKKMLLTTEGAL